MTNQAFQDIVAEEFSRAITDKFRKKMRNVGFVIEREPSAEVRKEHRLKRNETLLGLYHGVPMTSRGEGYGVGAVVPDVITLYQFPIEREAQETDGDVRRVVRETIWHEVGHHFGLDEAAVMKRTYERQRRRL